MLRRAATKIAAHGSLVLEANKPLEQLQCFRRTCAHQAAEPIAEKAAAPGTSSGAAPAAAAAGVPGVVKALGFGGAVPFWAFSPALAGYLPMDLLDPLLGPNTGLLQVGYGATILSFLGGVHWGLAMTNVGGALGTRMAGQRYVWSVLPCLMAWPTVAMPIQQAAATQAALLGVVYLVDKGWAKKGLLPGWYMNMRLPLTVLAAGGLALTAVSGT